MGRVRVYLAPTPNYGEDGVRRLLNDLPTEGLPVEQEYWLLRESAEADTALAAVLLIGGAVGGGVLGASGDPLGVVVGAAATGARLTPSCPGGAV